MSYIGTRAHAVTAYHRDFGEDDPNWSLCGSGGFRSVYLHEPSQVVYKVDNGSAFWGEHYTNKTELRHAQTLLREQQAGTLSKRIRIPKTSGYRIGEALVIAMEYIARGGKNATAPARRDLYLLGFGDMHAFNFIVDAKGKVCPIDMGSPRYVKRSGQADDRCLW